MSPAPNATVETYNKREVPRVNGDVKEWAGRLSSWLSTETGNIVRAIPNGWAWPVLAGEVGVRNLRYPPGNALRYGAVGDGAADNATALQNWLDSAAAIWPRGGGLELPEGQYATSATLIIKSQGLFIQGSGMSGKTVGAGTVSGGTQLIGTTAGMTVVRCSGVNDDGTTVMQGGPIFDGIAFIDSLGQATQTPGDMTLLDIRCANRWKLYNCGFFFADYGLKASKDTIGGASADCAQWMIPGSTFSFCNVGAWLNTFTGTVDTSWANGCGTGYLVEEDVVVQPCSGIGFRGCKFDILEPTITPAFTPGVGIQIGNGQNITVSECLFETQPQTDTPTTVGVLIDGNTNTTRVVVENSFFSNLYTGVDAVTARTVRVDNCSARSGSATMTVNAFIDFGTVTDAVVMGDRSDNLSNPPILLSGTTANLTVIGYLGTVTGAASFSASPLQFWKSGSCVFHVIDTGPVDFREVASPPTAPLGNHAYVYAQDDGGGKTQLVALFASGAAQIIATQP